jgi:hypothetical protein
MDQKTIEAVGRAYWSGQRVDEGPELESMGQPWTGTYCPEVLFSGRIDFENRNLDT